MVFTRLTETLRGGARGLLLSLALLIAASLQAPANDLSALKPKLGPHAIPIQQSHEYLRTNDAPDYWALSPYYVPQATNSACSLATITTMLNALRGLPPLATDPLVTPAALSDALGPDWASKVREGGEGVTFDEFKRYVQASLKAYDLAADIEVFKPADASTATLDALRRLLSENERSDNDIALVYFNQGVITGDWDGPHLSPIAAYDAARRRVLILDVDREWYGPYWTSDEKLLEAMLRPASAQHGLLAGETGGIVRIIARR